MANIEIKWDTLTEEDEKTFSTEAEARDFAQELIVTRPDVTKVWLCDEHGCAQECLK
jgi:hypothetical protein